MSPRCKICHCSVKKMYRDWLFELTLLMKSKSRGFSMDYDAVPLEGYRKIAFYCTTWGRGGQNAAKFAAGEVVENKQKLNRSFFSYNDSSSISLWQKKAVSPQTYIRDMSTPKNFWRAWGRIGLEIKSPECIEVEEREDFESKQENPKSMLLPLMLVSSLLIFPAAFPELSLQTTIPNPLLSILTKCPFSKDA